MNNCYCGHPKSSHLDNTGNWMKPCKHCVCKEYALNSTSKEEELFELPAVEKGIRMKVEEMAKREKDKLDSQLSKEEKCKDCQEYRDFKAWYEKTKDYGGEYDEYLKLQKNRPSHSPKEKETPGETLRILRKGWSKANGFQGFNKFGGELFGKKGMWVFAEDAELINKLAKETIEEALKSLT